MSVLNRYHAVCTTVHGEGSIAELDRDLVYSQFRRCGALLLRGFEVGISEFRIFSDKMSQEIVTHLNFSRPNYGDRSMTRVSLGNGRFFAHSEMAYFPFRPQVAWFYCKQPANEGGETTLYDGVEVLNRLPRETRSLFERQRLLFTNFIPHMVWSVIASDRMSFENMLAGFDPTTFSYQFDEHLNIQTRYVASAITTTRYGAAFSNSLLDFFTPSFEDGSLVPESALSAVITTTEEIAVPIVWEEGDVLMVDNARFMHGRRAFRDKSREIVVRFSNM